MTISTGSDKKLVNFGPLAKKVRGADVDPLQVDNARSEYANAFEFRPRGFATGGISTPHFSPIGL